MRFRTFAISMLIMGIYSQVGPYNDFSQQQADDSKLVASVTFPNGDFQFDRIGFGGYVPFNLPTGPSAKVTHVGKLPLDDDTELRDYAEKVATRAQKSQKISTSLTKEAIESGCGAYVDDTTGIPQCRYDFFIETDSSVYAATMTITGVSEVFATEILLTPVKEAE